jgi:hypothetical protein
MRFNTGTRPFVPATEKNQLLAGTPGAGLGPSDTLYVPRMITLPFKDISIPVVDTGGAAGGQGSLQIYQWPEGVIQFMGALFNLTTKRNSTGIAAGAALVGAVGSAAAGAADAALTGTEADMIASFAGTLTAGIGVLQKYGGLVAAPFDGHTTAIKAFLNLGVPDADISATDGITVNGTVSLYWYFLGDF